MTMSQGPCCSPPRAGTDILLVSEFDGVSLRGAHSRSIDIDTDDMRRSTEVVKQHRQPAAAVHANLEDLHGPLAKRCQVAMVDREVVGPLVELGD